MLVEPSEVHVAVGLARRALGQHAVLVAALEIDSGRVVYAAQFEHLADVGVAHVHAQVASQPDLDGERLAQHAVGRQVVACRHVGVAHAVVADGGAFHELSVAGGLPGGGDGLRVVEDGFIVEAHAAEVDAQVVEGRGRHQRVVELLGQRQLPAVHLHGVDVAAGRLISMRQFGQGGHLACRVAGLLALAHKGTERVDVGRVVVGGVEHEPLPVRIGGLPRRLPSAAGHEHGGHDRRHNQGGYLVTVHR